MSIGTKLVITACLLVFEFQDLYAQVDLSTVTEGKYKCGSSVKLRCEPATCCTGTITWKKDSTQTIMTAGNPTPIGKYTQTIVAGSHFDFTIEDIASTDFGSSYLCIFGGTPSNEVTLNVDDYYCPPCWDCGGKCFGFSLIGVIIVVIIGLAISKATDKLSEKLLKITSISGVVGLVVDAISTVLIGGLSCLCEEGIGYTCIFIGFGITLLVVLVVVLIFYCISTKGNTRKDPQGSKADSKEEMKLNEPVNL